MSLTVTLVSSSTNCLDVRWSSSASSVLLTPSLLGGQPELSYSYLVNVTPSDAAAGHQWTIVVRDSKTSALRLDLEHSGIVGTPLITVKRCCVTRSVLGDEHWRVTSTAASAAGNDDYDPLVPLLRRLRVSPTPATPLGKKNLRFCCTLSLVCLHWQCLLMALLKL